MTENTNANVLGKNAQGVVRIKREFEGKRAERLAFDTTNLAENSTWFEIDTFKLYFWDGSAWVTKG